MPCHPLECSTLAVVPGHPTSTLARHLCEDTLDTLAPDSGRTLLWTLVGFCATFFSRILGPTLHTSFGLGTKRQILPQIEIQPFQRAKWCACRGTSDNSTLRCTFGMSLRKLVPRAKFEASPQAANHSGIQHLHVHRANFRRRCSSTEKRILYHAACFQVMRDGLDGVCVMLVLVRQFLSAPTASILQRIFVFFYKPFNFLCLCELSWCELSTGAAAIRLEDPWRIRPQEKQTLNGAKEEYEAVGVRKFACASWCR